MTWLIATIGWVGAVSMLTAYLLLLGRRVSADGQAYLSLNLLGSACLAVSTSAARAWSSAAVNLIWLAIGIAPLFRAWAAQGHRHGRSAARADDASARRRTTTGSRVLTGGRWPTRAR